jgi:hypothetical protein
LRRESAQTPYQLSRAEEDAAINPALAFKPQHDFGITLPSFDDEDEENIDRLLDSVRDVIAEQEDWDLRDTVVLSVFSFHKEVMYRDLLNNEVAIAAHPLVQGLALGHRADQGLAFDPTPEEELDEQQPPESMVSILDCDASQRQCLVAAAVGQSFVMEGPPGTGKSQTIANMIADALGHNKSVLFVSEKAAALEVVQNRLDRAGLSEFVLELHSHKATRKQVAQTLGRSLTTRIASRDRIPDVELQRLIGHRRELTAYARAMNERREPLGKSVHDVIGELSGLQHLPQAPACDSIDAALTAVELARIYDAADALPRSWGPVERGDDFLWRSLVDGTLTQARRGFLMALRWHYRSQHEDLITYSNYSFYDGQLITFPSANTHGPDVGIELFVVPGVYRRGGARDNPIEAARVVERVLFHVREHPHLSIGVVAFSEAQASTIEGEILRCSEESPELRVMLEGDRLHGGFVKNLESVQGDERDIIIFSIGYGRDEAGRFTLNFGPLNKLGGHRRLNVAITRARRRVEVVSSIEASDFVGDLRSDGVRHLRRYLDFAARSENRLAALGVELGPSGRDSESPFEEEVARVVRSWGYDVVPQVGCADYRIDMAVKHPCILVDTRSESNATAPCIIPHASFEIGTGSGRRCWRV